MGQRGLYGELYGEMGRKKSATNLSKKDSNR